MEQKLRSYERLSPELAVLTEAPNINNPSTLMTDYLVSGPRGWDWLCQLHSDATIINLEDPSLSKPAVDNLVDFPAIIRAYDDGVGTYFVVTPLGADAKRYCEALEAKIKDSNATTEPPKQTLTLDIPADCDDPAAYVDGVIKNFMITANVSLDQVSFEFRTISDEQRRQFYKNTCLDVNIEDAYPKPGEKLKLVYIDEAPFFNKVEAPIEGKENVADLNQAPKIDLASAMACPEIKTMGIIDRDAVVAYDGVKEYTPFIRDWAKARNIIGGGSSVLDQFIKGLTEAGELWTHIGKGQRDLLKDDVGDIYVCLVNAAGNINIALEDHVRSLVPYNVHSGRSSYQTKGLKRWSLQVLYGMAAAALAIENIMDADNERDVESFKVDFCEACADTVYALETIALEHEWSLTDCVAAAYEDIKDRRGLMNDGCFVKEKDFTHAMVNRVLAEPTTTDGTRDYLNDWLAKNPSESVAPAAVKAKTPFWRLLDKAQGDIANIALFDVTPEVAELLSKQKDDQIVVTLGLFGQPNHNREIFTIGEATLKTRLDAMIGNQVGEVETPQMQKDQDVNSWILRILTTDAANTAGTLLGYAINDLGTNEHGPVIEVVGLVEPSTFTKDRIATAGNVYFGIRGLVNGYWRHGVRVNEINSLACFDLSIENPRELK